MRTHKATPCIFSRGSAVMFGLIFCFLALVAAEPSQAAENRNVRILMDWVLQGTHAPFFVAQDKGYFKTEGVNVEAIDGGKGATNTAVSVASGVYQFGFVDVPAMIRFNAQNPGSPLVAIYMSFDEQPFLDRDFEIERHQHSSRSQRQKAGRGTGHRHP